MLQRSLNHAREYTHITDEKIEIILAYRKSFLDDNGRTRVKSHVDNFDVSMGTYDPAQVADLINILDPLVHIINLEQVRLYDGIIFIQDSNGPKTSTIQKKRLLGHLNYKDYKLK